MNQHTQDKISDPRALAASCVMYMLAPVGMSLLPLMVGSASDSLGLTQQQSGYLASADLGGIAVASVLCAIWIRKLSWTNLAVGAILMIVVTNGLCIKADTFVSLCLLRFLTEFGHGIIYSLAIVSIGDSIKPDRYFAIGIGLTVFISILFFMFLPELIQLHGGSLIYITHGLVALLVLPVIFWFPKRGLNISNKSGEKRHSLIPLFIAMIAFGFFMATEGGIWAFIERFGNADGYSPANIGDALVATQVASVIGAIVASILSIRFGRFIPVLVGLLLFSLSLLLLTVKGYLFFITAACLTQFFYIFIAPYFLLMCVELDPTGRLYVLTTAFKLGGMSAGPSIIALFLSEGNYHAVSWVGVLFLIICLIMMTPLALRLDRSSSNSVTS